MANTVLATGLGLTKWSSSFIKEAVRSSAFKPYMGGPGSFIVVDRDKLKTGGERVRFAHLLKLRGPGVTGCARLKGNEEALGTDFDEVKIQWHRNAVQISKCQSSRTDLDLMEGARDMLAENAGEVLKNDIVDAMRSFIVAGTDDSTADTAVLASAANTAQKNAHLTNNADRTVVAGGAVVSGDYAATVAAATAPMSAKVVRKAKDTAIRTALGANYGIRPVKTDDEAGRDWFVMFVGLEGFEQLEVDPTIYAANKDARERNVDTNPIFQGGDLIYNGVIIRQVAELPSGEAYLGGQNGINLAWGQAVRPTKDVDDYGFAVGVGYEELRGQKISSLNGTATGIVRVLYNGAA